MKNARVFARRDAEHSYNGPIAMHHILALVMLALPGTALAQTAGDLQVPLGNVQSPGKSPSVVATAEPNASVIAIASPIAEPASAPKRQTLFGDAQVAEGELAKTHGLGLGDLLEAITSNISQVNGNKVGANSTTGDVMVADSAFQNLSGISIVNFNTGNNSSINAGMSVNLQINYAQPTH